MAIRITLENGRTSDDELIEGVECVYFSDGSFYFDEECLQIFTSLPSLPSNPGYTFSGYYEQPNGGGEKCINNAGAFKQAFLARDIDAPITLYAAWKPIFYRITIVKNGGTGGTDCLYYKIDGGGIYTNEECTAQAVAIVTPVMPMFSFGGAWTELVGTGTKYINNAGQIRNDFESAVLTGDISIYCKYDRACYRVTVDGQGGTGGTGEFYCAAATVDGENAFYGDVEMTNRITGVTLPTRVGYTGGNLYSSKSGGVKFSLVDGTFKDEFKHVEIEDDVTVYCGWTPIFYRVTVDKQGGAGGTDEFFWDKERERYCSDIGCTSEIIAVTLPTRSGYHDGRLYTQKNGGGVKVTLQDGGFSSQFGLMDDPTSDFTVYANWIGNEHTLMFDSNGGGGSLASKTVVVGSPIGTLPSATFPGRSFEGWKVDGETVGEDTIWTLDEDATAVADWMTNFGGVKDWFGLASSKLVPIASDSGDARQRVCVANATWDSARQTGGAGKYDQGVDEVGPILRNPTVTYMVVGDMTLNVVLGRGFAAKNSGSSRPTVSGYMITSVNVSTQVGSFPTVTVSATANEGYVHPSNGDAYTAVGTDAINTFALSVPIVARSKAQNLMGAIGGGGRLQACTLDASCTPVVLMEDLLPCASDVVAGRITVRAATCAPDNEGTPTAANGFTEFGAPRSYGETSYLSWSITAEKEMA